VRLATNSDSFNWHDCVSLFAQYARGRGRTVAFASFIASWLTVGTAPSSRADSALGEQLLTDNSRECRCSAPVG
jgi:hypothetical protein